LWLTGVYSDKRPNEHSIIVDEEGKWVEGTREKLEVCVVFFDKLYNCAPTIKLFVEAEFKEPRPPPKPPPHPSSPPLYSNT
jgi:hypothetical protein